MDSPHQILEIWTNHGSRLLLLNLTEWHLVTRMVPPISRQTRVIVKGAQEGPEYFLFLTHKRAISPFDVADQMSLPSERFSANCSLVSLFTYVARNISSLVRATVVSHLRRVVRAQ